MKRKLLCNYKGDKLIVTNLTLGPFSDGHVKIELKSIFYGFGYIVNICFVYV